MDLASFQTGYLFNRLIKHLRYRKLDQSPNEANYKFSLPTTSFSHPVFNYFSTTPDTPSKPQPPVSTYDQIPLQTTSTTPTTPNYTHGFNFLYQIYCRRWFDELYNIKKRHDAKEKDKQRALVKQNQAKMLGTSTNKLEQRVDLTRDLTKF
ncbi:12452_t:CDS:2 [Rhizophagus irregularis]|nr:12452_t:CDS:2 [Rhizophagus irregularis]